MTSLISTEKRDSGGRGGSALLAKLQKEIFLVKTKTVKPQATQVQCINYREFRYCFAYYERFYGFV